MKKVFIFLLLAIFSATLFAQRAVPRYTFLEMFTSCTCPPCVSGNINLKNMLIQNDAVGGKYTLIKYQMSWPGNGDPYYTAEGGLRRTVYSINGVPNLCMDGVNKQTSFNHNMLLQAQAVPSYVEVSGNYSVTGNTVTATIHVRPTMDISIGNNLKLYVAIVENITYNNKRTVPNQTNGETEFYQVMKKFMPDANGIILGNVSACELITHELTWEFQGNYRCPNNALSPINHQIEHSVENFDNLEVIAWVANTSNRQIYNSCTAIKGDFYAVNFDVSDNNRGTISATVNGTPITSGTLVEPGTEVLFTAEPIENYYVNDWELNWCDVAQGGSDNSFSLTVVDASVTVTALIIRDYNVKFDVLDENGSLTATINGEPIITNSDIPEGSIIELTAEPDEGFKVKEWKLNGNVVPDNTTNTYSFVLTNNAEVTVEFTQLLSLFATTYHVVNGNGLLTASVDDVPFESGSVFPIGAVIEFMATPDEKYTVKEWKHNDEIVTNNITNNFSITVSGEETVTVEFMEIEGIDVIHLSSVEIYPNPVTDELIIKNAEQVQRVVISNTLGQIVKEETLYGAHETVISTENLQSGLFFVTLKNNEGLAITRKIVKN
jgi:hypothetical protein